MIAKYWQLILLVAVIVAVLVWKKINNKGDRK